MKLAATIARSLQGDIQAELRDIERARSLLALATPAAASGPRPAVR